ncbi:neuropeptides capa receptor-like [Copidosoma floridanum]|uniref:neuropeptides capa receptor-like n=1 Tax=Copidosoma floridanum TaxID=29053 RepID=UPI000C6F9579|nr:neuropeptides capa receptor-like [Copidosoma floridanum]
MRAEPQKHIANKTSSDVSVLTIMMFTIERYFAICHPFNFNMLKNLHGRICLILISWIIASLCALPFGLYTTISYVEFPPGSGNYSTASAICAMLVINLPNYPIYELSSIVFFFIPMFVIIILYLKISLKIRESYQLRQKLSGKLNYELVLMRRKRGTTKMLGSVVLTFMICWAPFHIQRLLYIYGQDTDYYPDMNEWLYLFSGCFYYLNTAINPLLYNLMSTRFRKAYKQIFNCSKSANDL